MLRLSYKQTGIRTQRTFSTGALCNRVELPSCVTLAFTTGWSAYRERKYGLSSFSLPQPLLLKDARGQSASHAILFRRKVAFQRVVRSTSVSSRNPFRSCLKKLLITLMPVATDVARASL